jgi:hypothetical protein
MSGAGGGPDRRRKFAELGVDIVRMSREPNARKCMSSASKQANAGTSAKGKPAATPAKKKRSVTAPRATLIAGIGAAVLTAAATVAVEFMRERNAPTPEVSLPPAKTEPVPAIMAPPLPLPAKPLPFGVQTACRELAPGANVQTILDKFGQRATREGQPWLIGPSSKPVTVSAYVGGPDRGSLVPNARVYVVCMADADFAVIKEEHGNHDGVVERTALREP